MSTGQRRSLKPRSPSPIATAIQTWFATLHPDAVQPNEEELRMLLLNSAPKRWVGYVPMVLLPSGSFSSEHWNGVLGSLEAAHRDALWKGILEEISKTSKDPLTHLAINEGIPLHADEEAGREPGQPGPLDDTAPAKENVLRSPSGLRVLYGDFGPAASSEPSEADFDAAFWVSTKQNGIYQTWAPRWTMFSRGNVKEKARLLDFHTPGQRLDASHRWLSKQEMAGTSAVDLYAGIGYFVFSFARLGLRVLCWELNPWSVEGLRRGAKANRWSVEVLKGDDLTRPTAELVDMRAQIVVFCEDNKAAAGRIAELRASGLALDVLHVNCGYLPSSIETWRPAWVIQGSRGPGWLHLHENVGVVEIDARRDQIQAMFNHWAPDMGGSEARVEHVERVKTFAPDVWHCVFDVYVTPAASSNSSADSVT
ncbi:tRNA wybutosine-synthesizing protein [Thozetella sp. PMI_491]|nr:tRNA wybutosine-synthesizing protein [Thozetella sp. PMI_491]